MAAVLDIIQSIIIAGMITLMVLGVHLMTMKSSNENRVVHQMQGIADGTVSVLQEEIRFLHSFASDSLIVSSNALYFRKTNGNIVLLEAHPDTLTVSEISIGNQLSTGTVQSIPSSKSAVLGGTPYVMPGYLILLTGLMGEGQWKYIDSYNSGSNTATIRGDWDMIPDPMPEYAIHQATLVNHRSYMLNLEDKSNLNIFSFNLVKLNPDGSDATIAGNKIDAKDIDLIRVTASVKSRPDQFYGDTSDHYIIDLHKDFFLRGFRLPSAGG